MAQLDQLQKQMQKLQETLHEVLEEKKEQDPLPYKGINIPITLVISNKTFITNTYTLLNKQHGKTLFLQKFIETQQPISEGKNEENKSQQTKHEDISLQFQRNPDLFQYILDYLSGYKLHHQLLELTVIQLEKLQQDASYYQIKTLYNIISRALCDRFDPYLGSPLIEIEKNATVATRTTSNGNLWVSRAIYGVLCGTGTKYAEINIVTQGDRYIMLGVTEAHPFRIASYAGHNKMSGCGYYCSNGNLYRTESNEGWGPASQYGDRVGVLVKLNKEQDMAQVAFYKNGELMKNEINLKNYMNVDRGVVFVVSMHAANTQVQMVQNPVVPQ